MLYEINGHGYAKRAPTHTWNFRNDFLVLGSTLRLVGPQLANPIISRNSYGQHQFYEDYFCW